MLSYNYGLFVFELDWRIGLLSNLLSCFAPRCDGADGLWLGDNTYGGVPDFQIEEMFAVDT